MTADPKIPAALRFAELPDRLTQLPQWVIWRYEQREKDPKPTKVPYRARNPCVRASCADRETWASYEEASAAAEADDVAGVGIVVTPDDPLTGVDLDDCVTDNVVDPSAEAIVSALDSYTEISPSGRGLRVFIRATLNGHRNVQTDTPWGGRFEVYDRDRFLTVTGCARTANTRVEDRQRELEDVYEWMFPRAPERTPATGDGIDVSDDEILERARKAKNGAKFERLWAGRIDGHADDESVADLALCSMLAFWTGPRPDVLDRLFRRSGLMRDKWDERRGERTYGQLTLDKTLADKSEFYDGETFSPLSSTFSYGVTGAKDTFPPLSSTFSLRWPPALADAAYCGLAGRIVRELEPHTEADPAAVLLSLLTMFGNAIGRGPHFRAGDVEHATNIFACIVGETSSGRKGTSAEGSRRLFMEADPSWRRCFGSGLVSGEGVIHHVRDPRSAMRKAKTAEEKLHAGDDGLIEELVDGGAEDKRLMVFVPELAQLLAVVARKDSTLSAVLRDLWDRGNAQTLAKNSPERCTGALVSILAHVTPAELRTRLDTTEFANGFANRFVFCCARRSRLLPRGGSIPAGSVPRLARELQKALDHARRLLEVDMTDRAWALWDERYEQLTTRPPGLAGALTGRAAPIVRRLALIYALIDERSQVEAEHLKAALEVWRYAEESVRCVFGDRLGEQLADTILHLLREASDGGLTRTQLRETLGHKISAEKIADALQLLADAGLARCDHEDTGGRRAERWHAR